MLHTFFLVFIVNLIILIISSKIKCDQLENKEKLSNKLGMNVSSERILSRKRRYLVFPESSSLQLVFDQTITIVDYTFYITTGQTVALAWELPFEPLYLEELMDQYENGTLPLLNRNDENITDTTYTSSNNINNNTAVQATPITSQYSGNLFNRYPDSYYFGPQYYNQQQRESQYQQQYKDQKPQYYSNSNYRQRPATSDKYNYYFNHRNKAQQDDMTFYNEAYKWFAEMSKKLKQSQLSQYKDDRRREDWDIISNFSSSSTMSPPTEATTISTTIITSKDPQKKLRINPNYPFIKKKKVVAFPPMGKRDVSEKHQNAFVNHHRNTRYKLYKLVEKFMDGHGQNGVDCVLKTLCETGQMKTNRNRGSFLEEIVRAVFSLPNLNEIIDNNIHKNYHDAHEIGNTKMNNTTTTENFDCAATFKQCKGSIWTMALHTL